MILEELDSTGNVLAIHPKTLITKAGSWHYLSTRLTTKSNTAKIRFVLDTTLDGGAVGYDGCVLDGPPAPATLVGFSAYVGALEAEDPGCAVLPYCLSGGTDNKSLSDLGITGYGFAPLRLPEPGHHRDARRREDAPGGSRIEHVLPVPAAR